MQLDTSSVFGDNPSRNAGNTGDELLLDVPATPSHRATVITVNYSFVEGETSQTLDILRLREISRIIGSQSTSVLGQFLEEWIIWAEKL